MIRLRLSVMVLLTLLLAACGGSDNGGGITYTGISTQATLTSANATDLSTSAYQGGTAGSTLGALGAVQSGQIGGIGQSRILLTAQTLEKDLRGLDLHSALGGSAVGAAVSVSNTVSGNCGGTASYTISADDQTGNFSGTFTFDHYCNDGVTQNGSIGVTGKIDVNTQNLVTFSFSVNSFSVSSNGDSFSLTGNIALDFSTNPKTVTMSVLLRDNTGKVFWAKDYSLTVNDQGTYQEISITGRFYHPEHGYVEISTPTPLHVNVGDEFPSSGVLELSGANNTKVRLTADSSTTFHVEADADGDGVFEFNSGPLNWADI